MTDKNPRKIFGDWFVMTKEKELEWDTLIKELKNNGRYQQPAWTWTTAVKQVIND